MLKNSFLTVSLLCATAAWADVDVTSVYLRQEVEAPPTLSNLDPVPEDLGLAGAEVGLKDNQTTGRFLGQNHTLEVISVAPGGNWEAAVAEALSVGGLLILDAPAEQVRAAVALTADSEALLFNVAAPERDLREGACA
ncbi:MAG: branched-chain amino acid ABC transporter substrate-binding protein, partial [Pseudomonadota bacterium]